MDRARVAATVVSLALIGATLEPLIRDPYDDGFPLSTYPMFAMQRPTVQTFHYALGITRDGKRRTLSTSVVGTGEELQAIKVFDHAVARGRTELTPLCSAIAKRVAGDSDFSDVVTIKIVIGTHDAVEYLARGKIGIEREIFHCEVPR